MLEPALFRSGKKRVWIPDEKEAYIDVEIREISGDKIIIETKDGKVSTSVLLNKKQNK